MVSFLKQHQVSIDGPHTRGLDPYVVFVGAFLKQTVNDARSPHADLREPAQAFLLDLASVGPWIELTGGEAEQVQRALCRAAGL